MGATPPVIPMACATQLQSACPWEGALLGAVLVGLVSAVLSVGLVGAQPQ